MSDRIVTFNAHAARMIVRLGIDPDRVSLSDFYGPRNAAARAMILSELYGMGANVPHGRDSNVPKSRAGWNVFKSALYDAFGAEGDCDAVRMRDCEARILAEARRG